MPRINRQTKLLTPARTLVLGFLAIILIGSVLLWLPFASASGSSTPYSECLFTATSATCVTGITVVDTYSNWSMFGQIVIALLIQIGGLGFVTIITFFNVAAGKKLGFRTLANAADGLTEYNFAGAGKVFTRIIKYSFIIELAGALLLAIAFVPKYGAYGVWVSIFMSISAFCNAGFDLMGTDVASLIGFNDNPLVLITIALLIVVGGLGFVVWENFLNLRKVKKLSLHTVAVLVMTGVLILGGMIFYLLSEFNNPATMGEMSFGEKLLNAFFSSVSNRSAGFSSIDVTEMSGFSQLGTMLLMFVGAAPASTGGGIKVTTLLVLIMTVVSYIKNKNDVEIFRHKIDKLTVYRTLVITTLTMCAVAICFTAVYSITSADALQCLFESVAACSTAGLSLGVTASADIFGRIVIMLFMFSGRVGPVSLIMSLTMNSSKRKNIVVPDGQIFIG